jgi:hypothetical protein
MARNRYRDEFSCGDLHQSRGTCPTCRRRCPVSALAVLGKIWRAIRWRRVCRMIDANPEEAQEALRILDSQDWEDEGQERLPTGNKA